VGRHAEMEFGTDTILEVIIILTYEQLLTENLQYLHRHNVSLVGQDGSLIYSPPYVSAEWFSGMEVGNDRTVACPV
jgi:hypothetical protein